MGWGLQKAVRKLRYMSIVHSSILSSLDCRFLTMILPVVGLEGQEQEERGEWSSSSSTTTTIGLGLGLWTFERPPIPDDEGTSSPTTASSSKRVCVSYSAARSMGGLVPEIGFLPYYEYFGNSDRPWSLSRVFAVLGMLSGCTACVVLVTREGPAGSRCYIFRCLMNLKLRS